jgi:uncharacterized protein YodC (DUF2158 family)
MTFQPGDLVQLKSGGPTMRVEAVLNNTFENVRCAFFVNNVLRRYEFAADALQPFTPAAPTTPSTAST